MARAKMSQAGNLERSVALKLQRPTDAESIAARAAWALDEATHILAETEPEGRTGHWSAIDHGIPAVYREASGMFALAESLAAFILS